MSDGGLDILSLLKQNQMPPLAQLQGQNSPAAGTLQDLMTSVPKFQPSRLDALLGGVSSLGNYFGSRDIHGKGMSPVESAGAGISSMMEPYNLQMNAWSNKAKVAEQLARIQGENTRTAIDYEKAKGEQAFKGAELGETSRFHTGQLEHEKAETQRQTNRDIEEAGYHKSEVANAAAHLGIEEKQLQKALDEMQFNQGIRREEVDETKKEHEFNAGKPNAMEEKVTEAGAGVLDRIANVRQLLKDPEVNAKLKGITGRAQGLWGTKNIAQVLNFNNPKLQTLKGELETVKSSLPIALGGATGGGGGGAALIKRYDDLLNSNQGPESLNSLLDAIEHEVGKQGEIVKGQQESRRASYRTAGIPGTEKGKQKEPGSASPRDIEDLLAELGGKK